MESRTPSTDTEDKTFWEMHYKQFKLSQLSKAEYTRRHKLVKHRFIYCIHKFEMAAKATKDSKADFIPITVKANLSMREQGMPVLCTFQLDNSKQLHVHTEAALTRIFHEKDGGSHEIPLKFRMLKRIKGGFHHDKLYQGEIDISTLPKAER